MVTFALDLLFIATALCLFSYLEYFIVHQYTLIDMFNYEVIVVNMGLIGKRFMFLMRSTDVLL